MIVTTANGNVIGSAQVGGDGTILTNKDVTISTLTALAATTNSGDQTNYDSKGLILVVNLTAVSGTSPTLVVTIQGKDVASGTYYTLLASASLTATGTTVMRVFPGATASANVAANDHLPATYRILYTVGGTTPSFTGTVGASLLKI